MIYRLYARYTGFTILHVFAVYLLLPVLGPFFRSLGYSDAWIALVFGLFGLASIVAGVHIGTLTSKFGRLWVLRTALLVNVAAFGLYMLGAPWALILARLIDGACFVIIAVVLMALIEDSIEDRERGSKTGLLLTLENGARLLAPVLGGALADYFIGYPFFLTIGIFIALFFTIKSAPDNLESKTASPTATARLRTLFASAHLRPLIVLGMVISASTPVIMLFIPLLISSQLGLSYAQAGFAITVYGAAHLLQFFFGHLSDAYGRKRLLTLGGLVYGLALLGIATNTGEYNSLMVFIALAGLGNSLWSVAATSYLAGVSHTIGGREEMIGTYVSVIKVGEVAAYFVTGLVAAAFNAQSVFNIFGWLIITGSLVSSYLFIRLFVKERDGKEELENNSEVKNELLRN